MRTPDRETAYSLRPLWWMLMFSASALVGSVLRGLLLPPACLFLLLAIAMLVRRRYPRVGQSIAAASVVGLYVLCTGVGSALLVAPLEQRAIPLNKPTDTGAQAIVVLAAGRYVRALEYGNREIPDYIALARLRYAAKLYRETGLPLLVSGSNGDPNGPLKPKAVAMAAALQDEFAVPVRWIEQASENTSQNAELSARILKAAHVNRILLVTDAMHMPRSVRLFEATGIEVVAAPTIFFSTADLGLFDLLPTAEALRRSHYAAYEWAALARDDWLFWRQAGRCRSAAGDAGPNTRGCLS